MVKVLLAGQEPLSGSDAALIPRYVRIGGRPTSFRLQRDTSPDDVQPTRLL